MFVRDWFRALLIVCVRGWSLVCVSLYVYMVAYLRMHLFVSVFVCFVIC